MTMQFVPIPDGQSWEWDSDLWRFQAISYNGSPVVTLNYRTRADEEEAEWIQSHVRASHGRPVKTIAEQMYQDTTGRSLYDDLIAQLRLRDIWLCRGTRAGQIAVVFHPLYLDAADVEAVQLAFGQETPAEEQ